MTSNELRIGNWVMGNKPYQWGLDDFADWYYDHNSHTYGDSVKPIPLTEEWLLKFGFEKLDDCKVGYEKVLRSGHIINFFNSELFCYLDNIALNDIKYAHHLQNLYFALTGEELTVK